MIKLTEDYEIFSFRWEKINETELGLKFGALFYDVSGNSYSYLSIKTEEYKGKIYIYGNKNIQLKLLTDKKIIGNIIPNLNNEEKLLLFYLMGRRHGNYIFLSEKIYILIKNALNEFSLDMIYKNNIYIIKINSSIIKIFKRFFKKPHLFYINVIYHIIKLKDNKISVDTDKEELIKKICETCKIKYIMRDNYIEILWNIDPLEKIGEEYYNGKLYSLYENYLVLIHNNITMWI